MSAEQDLATANVQIANLIAEVTRFRDAAMGINNIWPTITEGRQNTADGKYFSVPGGGAYMRLYRRNGSSQTLIAEFPDRAELNSVIDQLGPLLGRGVVGGSGNLMAEGYGGLGAVAPVWPTSDLFDTTGAVPNSTYRYGAVSNQPTGAYGEVVYLRGAGGETLIATVSAYSNASSPSLYIARKTSNGEWSGWSHQYGTHNALGAVSQSAGVPTGAVIERGSNGFGSWIKHLDGSMIMFVDRDYQINGILNQGLYETDDTPLGTLPQSHVGPLYIAGTRSSSRQWVVPRTAGFFRVYSIFSITAPLYIQFTIHKRWY
mgnify:CR=1 FL=1